MKLKKNTKKKILIYNGSGTKQSEVVYQSVVRFLNAMFLNHKYSVSFVGPSQLFEELKKTLGSGSKQDLLPDTLESVSSSPITSLPPTISSAPTKGKSPKTLPTATKQTLTKTFPIAPKIIVSTATNTSERIELHPYHRFQLATNSIAQQTIFVKPPSRVKTITTSTMLPQNDATISNKLKPVGLTTLPTSRTKPITSATSTSTQNDVISCNKLKPVILTTTSITSESPPKTLEPPPTDTVKSQTNTPPGDPNQNIMKLLIIPGGRDLPYVEHINQDCCDLIKKFISNGGSYLGICAGAYFSSSHVIFDPNGPLQVVGPRSLGLFPGHAVGPAYPGFVYNSTCGSRMVTLKCEGYLREKMRHYSDREITEVKDFLNRERMEGDGRRDMETKSDEKTILNDDYREPIKDSKRKKVEDDDLNRENNILWNYLDHKKMRSNDVVMCSAYYDGGGYFDVSAASITDTKDFEILAYYSDSVVNKVEGNSTTGNTTTDNMCCCDSGTSMTEKSCCSNQSCVVDTFEEHSTIRRSTKIENHNTLNSCQNIGFYNNSNVPHTAIINSCNSILNSDLSGYYKDVTTQQQQQEPAIVRRGYGKGKVILSMVHPEMSCKYLNESDYTTQQWSSMVANERVQLKLWTILIESLLS